MRDRRNQPTKQGDECGARESGLVGKQQWKKTEESQREMEPGQGSMVLVLVVRAMAFVIAGRTSP